MNTKPQALQLISNLAKASVNHYAVANALQRGNPALAADKEGSAARKLLKALGHEATKGELAEALWQGGE